MKLQAILREDVATPEPVEAGKQLVKSRRGFMVWYQNSEGLKKYVIARLNQNGDVADISSTATSRNGIKQLYSRKQAKAIADIIKQEHPEAEPRIIRCSMEQYDDGTVSVNVD